MIRVEIKGVLTELESGRSLAGLYVKAHDKDMLFDDLLGSAFSGSDGTFLIITTSDDFRDFFERNPDVYMTVRGPRGEPVIFSTEDQIRWNVSEDQFFDIRIPRHALQDIIPPPEVVLTDDNGEIRADFDVAEPLVLGTSGLRPSTPHGVAVLDSNGTELLSLIAMSDRNGVLPATIIWPQMGFDDPRSPQVLTLEEARKRWAGQRLQLRLSDGTSEIAKATFDFARVFNRPLVLGTDAEGRLRNGFQLGTQDAIVSIHNAPWSGTVRIYLVPRQHNWRVGDSFFPVTLNSGRPGYADTELTEPCASVQVRVARARELAVGAYDLIVRPLRYGYEDDEILFLRETDLVGYRLMTGLVVRQEFMASKFARGGCVNLQQISGRRLIGRPYFQFTNVFQKGEDVWGALDPNAIDPNHQGKMAALYVIQHKTAAQWSADTSLAHLPQLGGNASVPKLKVQTGCVNYNEIMLWPNATAVGDYDVIADFGNNVPDSTAFAPDASFDYPLDMIDGYVQPGFKVIDDPAAYQLFTHAGVFEYNNGPITVTDDAGSWDPYASELSPGTVSVMLDAKARVYFPADSAGATSATQISGADPSYPLFVIVHGNSGVADSYKGYNYLLEHLAKNGFIAASIHCSGGMRGRGRAEVLFYHLAKLKQDPLQPGGLFGNKAANNIGIMGHSRGGEAVVKAARMAQQQGLPHALNAVISLAPTDQYGHETLGGLWAKPYMVVYGSMDGDVAGWPESSGIPKQSGFSIYDRANGAVKSMHFVYGATHNRFNTLWGTEGGATAEGQGNLLNADAHQAVAKGYMTAFLRRHLLGQVDLEGFMKGELIPVAVQVADSGKARVFTQYQDVVTNRLEVDSFEGTHTPTSWQVSSIGGTVDDANTLPVDPQEDKLIILDASSPHDTAGCLMRWDGTGDAIRFDLVSPRDVSSFATVSVRISQKVGSGSNPLGSQDLYLSLKDQAGNIRDIMVSKFGEVPEPHFRPAHPNLTKSALTTIRIPLHAYTIKVAAAQDVDLTHVTEVALKFGIKPTGEIEVDSLEFSH